MVTNEPKGNEVSGSSKPDKEKKIIEEEEEESVEDKLKQKARDQELDEMLGLRKKKKKGSESRKRLMTH